MATAPRPVLPSSERDRLVRDHMRLAYQLARRYARRRDQGAEVLQAALVGLVAAAARFDPGRGVSFPSFAAVTILGEIKHHFRNTCWSVRVPRSVQDRYLQVRESEERLAASFGRAPTRQEIGSCVGATVAQVAEAKAAAMTLCPISMSYGGWGGDATKPLQIGAPDADLEAVEVRQLVSYLLSRLEPRERQIVMLRFGEDLSQDEIAAAIGISQMQVSRLLARSLERMRILAGKDSPSPPTRGA
jgi:RNA polymerase sigma-B factor